LQFVRILNLIYLAFSH